ncbi:MAG: hypothetical protein IPQ13_04110 [Holophagaceae bacterium]|nr:hypothetical protein [Holophagaceae bacterium]
MAEPITAKQLGILQHIARNPGAPRAVLLSAMGASPADLKYLVEHDMIRERAADCFHVSHFGEMVLRRSL